MKLLGKNNFLFWVLFCVLFFSIKSHAALEELEQALVVLEDRLVTLSVTLSDLLLQTKNTTEPTSSLAKQKALLIAKLAAAHKKASQKLPDIKSDTKPDVKKSFVSKPGELEGENIVLKPYAPGMFDAYYKNYTQTVSQGYKLFQWGVPAQYAKQVLWEHLVRCQSLMANKKNYIHYCVFDKTSGGLIGEIEIRQNMPPGDMGIWLNENFWGKGIMKEAVKLTAREYFKRYPSINSFTSAAASWNLNSIKGHLKAGFQPIGFSHDAADNLKSFIEGNKLQPYYHQTAILGAIKVGTLKGLPPAKCFFKFTKDALAKL